jgi:hypothetical protein
LEDGIYKMLRKQRGKSIRSRAKTAHEMISGKKITEEQFKED